MSARRIGAGQFAAADELDTPYRNARDEWAGLIGASQAQLKGLRRILVGLVVVLGFAICGMFALAFWKQQVVVYGIETDAIGQVQLRGPLRREYTPNDPAIRFHLVQFVDLVRRVTADPPLTKQGREQAFWYATKRGGAILEKYFAGVGSPASLAKEGTISIEVTSALKISEGSWQVDWIERRRDRQGSPTGETTWRGSFRVRTHPPKDEDQLERNPIGMYVDELNWVRLKD